MGAAKKNKLAGFPVFDPAKCLKSDTAIAAYFNAAVETGDPSLLVAALADIARARNLSQLAKDAGLGRESLYKIFADGSKPQFESIMKITHALGLEMVFRPASARSAPAAPRKFRTKKRDARTRNDRRMIASASKI